MASSPAPSLSSSASTTPRTPRTPGFNTKSPTVKRILQEARELSLSPDPTLYAAPLETNLFEWHFTIAGPPSTPYSNGIYHGRIILPSTYPLRPPSFRFLTPSGRFETNREICLSISGHHEESWQPAWGIRTALCAIRAFMAGEAKGQVGGLDMQEGARKRLALESKTWTCQGCGGKSNEEILKEVEKEAQTSGETRKEDTVPEELRLAYREDLGEKTLTSSNINNSSGSVSVAVPSASLPSPSLAKIGQSANSGRSDAERTTKISTRLLDGTSSPVSGATTQSAMSPTARASIGASSSTGQSTHALTNTISREEPIPAWLDKAITGLVFGLAFMILKKILL